MQKSATNHRIQICIAVIVFASLLALMVYPALSASAQAFDALTIEGVATGTATGGPTSVQLASQGPEDRNSFMLLMFIVFGILLASLSIVAPAKKSIEN